MTHVVVPGRIATAIVVVRLYHRLPAAAEPAAVRTRPYTVLGEASAMRTNWPAGVVTIVGVLCAGSVLAQQVVDPAPPVRRQDEKPAARDDGRRTVSRLPVNLILGAFGVFSARNLPAAIAGSGATVGAAFFDDQLTNGVGSQDVWRPFETGGRPASSAGALGVVFVAGRFVGGPRFRAASYDWLDACLITAGYTGVLQRAIGRERPSGEANTSFPSGHTSNAFALAAVAERHYGWKVGLPAYALASAIGASRLRRNAHYLSDVVGGATLGYIVGHTVVRVNDRAVAGSRRTQINVSPLVGRTTRAVAVQVSF